MFGNSSRNAAVTTLAALLTDVQVGGAVHELVLALAVLQPPVRHTGCDTRRHQRVPQKRLTRRLEPSGRGLEPTPSNQSFRRDLHVDEGTDPLELKPAQSGSAMQMTAICRTSLVQVDTGRMSYPGTSLRGMLHK
jgi:hypothetical protein